MAGRGCNIQIKLLGGAGANSEGENIYLPVALHTQLSVLKEQLASYTSIPPASQVLILCDLADPERNHDRLLEFNNLTLNECGIRNNSVLTLHALGLAAEKQARKEALAPIRGIDAKKITLETTISADRADHSYNGIIFDVESKGPYEIELISVSIAGMLGRVTIHTRDRGWEENKPTTRSNQHWWAHHDSVSRDHWKLVADRVCRPSWDRPLEIKLNTPLIVPPHSKRALYCHSGLPDDLGIQYQSYPKSAVVAEDEYLRVLPGLGHTGSRPFDDQHGWYRSYRGLAGSVGYRMQWKGWSIPRHIEFPVPLKLAVKAMLLCNFRLARIPLPSCSLGSDSAAAIEVIQPAVKKQAAGLGQLPVQVVFNILEFMHFDWFEEVIANEEDEPLHAVANTVRRGVARATHTSAQMMVNLMQYLTGGAAGGLETLDDNQTQTLMDLVEHMQHQQTEDDDEEDDDEDEDYEDIDADEMEYGGYGEELEFVVDEEAGDDGTMDIDDDDEDDDDNDGEESSGLWEDAKTGDSDTDEVLEDIN